MVLPLLYLGLTARGFHPASRGFAPVARRWPRLASAAATVAEAFPGRHYHALYLGEIAATRPDYLRGLLDELFADMQDGTWRVVPAASETSPKATSRARVRNREVLPVLV